MIATSFSGRYILFAIFRSYITNVPKSHLLTSLIKRRTAKNTAISPDFLMWKFCGKAQFRHRKSGKITAFFPVAAIGRNVELNHMS